MQVEGNSYGNYINGMELNGKQPCNVLKAIPINGRAPHGNSVTDLKINPKPAPPSQSCPNGVCIAGDNNGVATVNNYANAPRPPDPHDPYSSKTDEEVARVAIDEADKVERRSNLCLQDAAAVASGQQPILNIDATVLATRTHFRWSIEPEIETIENLHDSMLRRMPSARDATMESYYQQTIRETECRDRSVPCEAFCWNTLPDASIPAYLRKMAAAITRPLPK